jgi:hypothetical protein
MSQLDELMLEFIENRIPYDDHKLLFTSRDVMKYMNEEDEEEIKNELYNYYLMRIRWSIIISQIRASIDDEEEENSDSE